MTSIQLKTVNNQYEIFTSNKFFKEYNYTKEDYVNNPIIQFRYMCYKMIPFIKTILIPNIQQKSYYEAVFVEFRILPHIEFIIRNSILKLGRKWSFTIICGNLNYEFMVNMCKSISTNITIIKRECDNMTQEEYSNMLITTEFWNTFYGNKILIQQEDTLMFKSNIGDFINYDFIGAPFPSNSNDTPNKVGNGGFSLRSKHKMLEIISKCNINDLSINLSTVDYMSYRKLNTPPEDVYFSKNLQDFKIGNVADWTVASSFSSETVFNKDSLGCHKLWIGTNEWKSHIKRVFNFKLYKPNSNLQNYLHYLNRPEILDITNKRDNVFDIDLYFYAKVNNIEYYPKLNSLYDHMHKNGLRGLLYHPSQLLNLYPNAQLYTFLDNLYVVHNNDTILTIQEFVNKYIYNSSFEYLADLTINIKYNTLNDQYDLILLVFIDDAQKGIDLLNKIIEYKKIEPEFNIAFCFHKNIYKYHSTALKKTIKDNFDLYSIYVSAEFGSDIIPTLLMYNDIIKTHNFKHIIKLHTNSCSTHYMNSVSYLLRSPIKELITYSKDNSNCIGYSYLDISTEAYNNYINNLYKSDINVNFSYVPGSVFYTNNVVMIRVLSVLKNISFRYLFLNYLYDATAINDHFTHVHFLERLFGIVKL